MYPGDNPEYSAAHHVVLRKKIEVKQGSGGWYLEFVDTIVVFHGADPQSRVRFQDSAGTQQGRQSCVLNVLGRYPLYREVSIKYTAGGRVSVSYTHLTLPTIYSV